MAKLTTNTAHEVARWNVSIGDHFCGQMVLRSDGAILRKGTVPGDGWTRTGKTGPALRTQPDVVARLFTKRGYTMTRVK